MALEAPGRVPAARIAARAFLSQTYTSRELIIVNGAGVPVIDGYCRGIREVFPGPLPVNDLLNCGCELATGEWWLRWDADDWSHPERTAYQMAHRRPGYCVLLRRHLRVIPPEGEGTCAAVELSEAAGILSTMLWPAGDARFTASRWWDLSFLLEHYEARSLVVDNTSPDYHIGFWHSNHSNSARDFVQPSADGLARVPAETSLACVKAVLRAHGLCAEPVVS